MSDKAHRTIGAILLTASIILCLASLVNDHSVEDSYQSKGIYYQPSEPVQTEKNGSIMVNDAGMEELMQLHGIGETLSRLIVEERAMNGPFFYPEDLIAVKGIGPRTLELFRDMIDLSQKGSEE